MEIFCAGTARIIHLETGEEFEIDADSLDWGIVDSSDRSMGAILHYQASVEHPELGSLSWSVWEYPVGAENMKETDIGNHTLIENFDFGLRHTTDEARSEYLYFSEEDMEKGITADRLQSLNVEQQIPYLVYWFNDMYWDPAHETPYNSREGGYLYVHGGPYDASEELYDEFGAIANEEAIEKAVEEVESTGVVDWAPSPRHPDQQAAREEYESEQLEVEQPTLEKIYERLDAGIQPHFGGYEERKIRQDLEAQITELQNLLEKKPLEHGGIGHNQPPEGMEIEADVINELSITVNIINLETEKDSPNVKEVAKAAGKLEAVISYGAKKLDLTVDAFLKRLGERAADAVAVGLALEVTGIWDLIWVNIVKIYELSLNWLDVVLSLF